MKLQAGILAIQTKPLMNTIMNFQIQFPSKKLAHGSAASVLTLLLLAGVAAHADDAPETFATPEAAVAALESAVQAPANSGAFRALFGSDVSDLVNPDPVQGAAELARFAAAFNETNNLVHESATRCTLELGLGAWPFPIPIVQTNGSWFFDTAAGKDELLNRRIGRNELETLRVVRAYVVAQREYASQDRNGDQVLEYAQKIISSPGKKDGLYWSPDIDGELSPLGPLVAEAQDLGYDLHSKEAESAPQPYQGYYFKILTRQGKSAPGGKYDYIINGHMIGGFALVAWPAEYGHSGIMTFIVNQQGKVYQKDLGPNTGKLAAKMKTYDPDPTWQVSQD
jgi:hypothetical protein